MDLPDDPVDVLVVGAGQAGLGTAHALARAGVRDVLVLDAAEVGSSWLRRWDSLRLFTDRRFSRLPGLRFPRGAHRFPSRLEMAAYLHDYAGALDVPVRTGTPVERLTREGGLLVAATPAGPVRARQVVVANGPFRRPRVPAQAAGLDPAVLQLHSAGYRRPADVPPGPVLVVGGGNSAAQLAVELARSGREVTVAAPREPWYRSQTTLGISLHRWLLLSGVLNAGSRTPLSRYLRRRGDVVVGRELQHALEAGALRLLPHRLTSASGTRTGLADGTSLEVAAVLWCTGFLPDTAWVQIPGATDAAGTPVHSRGASPVPGLHWMGLPWQTRVNSSLVDGVDRDARRTAARIRRALRAG
ncbi:flavin-containing monooxygenase [Trujillonella humicola]|uniref:flavin-containing monooxygenase n=1 Tax=Trujillonella humicola TaxID=3383699 RepID=UPI003905AA17